MEEPTATMAGLRSRVTTFRVQRVAVRRSAAVFVAVVLGAGFLGGPADAAGPFEGLAGTWSGRGTVTLEGGNTEALRCMAYYVSRDAGAGLGLAIRCASASYKTEIRSSLHHANGRISGAWEERSFNASGVASGVISPDRMSLQISGAINGSMTIVQSDSKQSVSISTGGGGLAGVSISLSRM